MTLELQRVDTCQSTRKMMRDEDRIMRLLDLYCGAGGAAMGYHRAGFEVVGVDIKPQPHYPFPFIQGDALDILRRMMEGEKFLASNGIWYGLDDFDAIHVSPPCQGYSEETQNKYKKNHPKLIPLVRQVLIKTGKYYVIENVKGARFDLINPIILCGSMFGLRLWRHRYFEINPPPNYLVPSCNHGFVPILITGTQLRNGIKRDATKKEKIEASGIDWMTLLELDQAIPPVYTEFIGRQLISVLKNEINHDAPH